MYLWRTEILVGVILVKNLVNFDKNYNFHYNFSCILGFPDNVSNMLQKLYPTTVDVQFNKLTTRIRESLSTVSEFECGAHAHLSVGPIDYFLYLSDTGICYLGDFSVSPHASVEENNFSIYTIRIDRGT